MRPRVKQRKKRKRKSRATKNVGRERGDIKETVGRCGPSGDKLCGGAEGKYAISADTKKEELSRAPRCSDPEIRFAITC